jgi:hypothetical protein
MAYAPVDPPPINALGTLKMGVDPGTRRAVLRGCVDGDGVALWCNDPPAGEIECPKPCFAGGKPLILTRR